MKLLIFDFDGTIADTKSLYYHAIYNNVKRFGYSYKDVDKVIDLGTNLRKVLRRLGFSFVTSWFLHKKIMKGVEGYAKNIKKCKDVDSIKDIKEKKILVSNSLKEFMLPILRHLKLRCFREIYGAEDFADKAEFIKKYMEKNKIKKQDCYYIGDRATDVKTARKAGCRSVIITGECAWDSQKEIIEQQPDFLVHSIKDIKEIVS
jgi:phosphoglycolate phosphatase